MAEIVDAAQRHDARRDLGGFPVAVAEVGEVEITAAVRTALGATAFEQSMEEGRMLGRDAAVELALGSGDRSSVESRASLAGTVGTERERADSNPRPPA